MALDKTGRLKTAKAKRPAVEVSGSGDNVVHKYEGDGRSFLGNNSTERDGIPGLQTPGKILIWRSGA